LHESVTGLRRIYPQERREETMYAITMEQKVGQRLVASLSVALWEGTADYVVDTANVGGTGPCLCPKKLFPVGTQLHLIFGRRPELPALGAEGIVRWCEGGKGVGVEFTSISPQARQALLRFVNSQSRREQA
jgi:hypothetical protein